MALTRTSIIPIVVGVFLCSLSAVVLILGNLSWKKYYELNRVGRLAPAEIVAKEPENHLSLRYSFSVAQNTFSGMQSVGPRLEQFKSW